MYPSVLKLTLKELEQKVPILLPFVQEPKLSMELLSPTNPYLVQNEKDTIVFLKIFKKTIISLIN